MSDPEPLPGHRTPPRAEPQQPDRPRGDGRDVPQDGDGEAVSQAEDRKREQREQTDNASRNVREGYN